MYRQQKVHWAEVHDMLQRMTELAVKAANGTQTSADRGYINQEVQALVSEIDRVASTTTFNEQMLLDGSFKKVGIQVGAEANQLITLNINAMSAKDLVLQMELQQLQILLLVEQMVRVRRKQLQ